MSIINEAPQPDLRDDRVRIRPLRRADLEAAERWPASDDPLYEGLGQPLSRLEKDLFFEMWRWPLKLELAIEDSAGALVGRMHLREISLGRRQVRLGIVLGAPWVGQGLGSAALRLFLPYYFGPLGFERMLLDVSASNRRALRVYEKFGFHPLGAFWREGGASRRLGWLERPEHRDLAGFFRVEGDVYWALYYEMELRAEDLVLPPTR